MQQYPCEDTAQPMIVNQSNTDEGKSFDPSINGETPYHDPQASNPLNSIIQRTDLRGSMEYILFKVYTSGYPSALALSRRLEGKVISHH